MNSDQLCAICGRPLGAVRVQEHHLIPRTFKGKETISIHQICHQKIHATFTERELLNHYNTAERINGHSEMEKFIKWVKNKPLDFYSKNDQTAHVSSRKKRK